VEYGLSRLLTKPDGISRAELVQLDQQGSWALDIANRIHESLRSYRRDRCALFINSDSTYEFLRDSGLQADILKPDENWHWTGMHARRKLKSVLVADYQDWFHWFMRWQRFNAFQIVIFITPIGRIVEYDKRGYIDGLLARLLNRPNIHRIIVVEEERFQPIVRT
jgi:hypothetical protein